LCIAVPQPDTIFLRPTASEPLPHGLEAVAHRCRRIEFEGSGGTDEQLRRFVSPRTESIQIFQNGVTGECLAFARDCPRLSSVETIGVTLTSGSLSALLNHPSLDELDIQVNARELEALPELSQPSSLQRLIIDLNYWPFPTARDHSALVDGPSEKVVPVPSSPPAQFVWLKQCEQLREVTVRSMDPIPFLEAVGTHLQGVERINAGCQDVAILSVLGRWPRLRHLSLEGFNVNDDMIGKIVAHCSGLSTLEIDEYSSSQVAISPDGLRMLKALSGLKRLRLGRCLLNHAHMKAIAELRQIEELSFEDDSIDNVAIEPLSELPNLRRISLKRTRVSGSRFRDIQGDWDEWRPWRN